MSLEIHAGEIVALLGSNGAGKSTLNNTVCGLVPALGGSVAFDGADLTRALPRHRRGRPDPGARGSARVPEPVGAREPRARALSRGRARRAANLERVFAIFPRLKERTAQQAGTMSGGEQQMLAIGRGLMAEPRLLILDEPSLGLSPLLVEELFALVRRLHADGLSVLLVEQNVAQSLEIAHAPTCSKTAPSLPGTPAELLAWSELKRAYLGYEALQKPLPRSSSPAPRVEPPSRPERS